MTRAAEESDKGITREVAEQLIKHTHSKGLASSAADRNTASRTAAIKIERRALRVTLWGNAAIALLGITFAIKTRSEAIFLDGLFSGIHLAISLLSIYIARLIQRPSDNDYPFGYAMFEPFLNMGKGLSIIVVALFALFSAVMALLDGGRAIDADIALWYALLASGGCLVMALMQRHYAKKSSSPILELDYKNWLIDGVISGAVALAFGLILLLQDTDWRWFIPYADPALVFLLVLLVLPLPLQTVIKNSLQMMGKAPDEDQSAAVEKIVIAALASVPHQEYHLRQTNMGRLLYVQVYLCVSLSQEERYQAGEVDRVRSLIYEPLSAQFPFLAMDLVMTCDPIWVDRAVMPVG
ncbi:MAG: cation diffusion facilitator family transporter [Cyanobacteria bacterium J06560_2]